MLVISTAGVSQATPNRRAHTQQAGKSGIPCPKRQLHQTTTNLRGFLLALAAGGLAEHKTGPQSRQER